jgi:NAD(P)H-hydrate epimerase
MIDSFPIAPTDIPHITTEQMREVDRSMIEDFGISLLQMMENAGRNLAEVVVRTVLGAEPSDKQVLVAAGPGGNGGGALVAARHLHNRGSAITVILVAADESKITEAVRHQLRILRSMDVPVESPTANNFERADCIIDGIFGYSLTGNPREPAASLISKINESSPPVISNDIPSGIDASSGRIYEPVIRANATVTIALPKSGLNSSAACPLVGDLYLGDISVPSKLYQQSLNIEIPAIFAEGSVLRLPNDSG